MHKKHPAFQKPENENVKIWRYMDFTKFISMLESRALYFTRVDLLDDKFEGSVPQTYYPSLSDDKQHELTTGKTISRIKKARTKWRFVNCWHMNNVDSNAMWKLYLKSNEGIAIQSTYLSLSKCFNECPNEIWIGVVKYIDYRKGNMPSNNTNYPFVYKRKSFAYEHELRAVTKKLPKSPKGSKNGFNARDLVDVPVALKGLNIPVNLETLIHRVYVSPYAEDWFEDLVKSIMDKYHFSKNVKKSSLADDPKF